MNTLLLILAILCLIVGLLGALLPGLPGPPLSWLGLLLASLTPHVAASPALLIATAVVAAAITVLDYLVPSLSTKHFGGSRSGVWGCNIGLIVSIIGLPFGPQGLLGMVLWPFVGALVGELLHCHELRPALRAAWGAFLGFLGGTIIKLAYCLAVAILVAVRLF